MKLDQLVSKRDWFNAQQGFCWLCGTPMRFKYAARDPGCATFDHLIPVREGGTWRADNLLLAHQDCNSRRGHSRHIFWLPPPYQPRIFTFAHPHRRFIRNRPVRAIRPERASVHRAWTRAWMIDKGLMKP